MPAPDKANKRVCFQFIFISTGWLVSHEIWRLFNPDTDTEVDLDSLVNFIVTDQRGLGGASISLGYVSLLLLLLLNSNDDPFPGSDRSNYLDSTESTGQPRNE